MATQPSQNQIRAVDPLCAYQSIPNSPLFVFSRPRIASTCANVIPGSIRSKFAFVTGLIGIIATTPSGAQMQATRNPPIRSNRFFVILPTLPDAACLVKKMFRLHVSVVNRAVVAGGRSAGASVSAADVVVGDMLPVSDEHAGIGFVLRCRVVSDADTDVFVFGSLFGEAKQVLPVPEALDSLIDDES